MGIDWINYTITLFIAVLSSVLTTYLYNKNYSFFHTGKEKYEIENSAPRIFIGKLSEIASNNIDEKVVSVEIKSVAVSVDNKDSEKEELIFTFLLLDKTPTSGAFADCGIRIHNNTNEGISLEAFYGKHGEIISFVNFPHRYIDALNSTVLLFSRRDKPQKITALFKNYRLTYTFNSERNYISPTAKKIRD